MRTAVHRELSHPPCCRSVAAGRDHRSPASGRGCQPSSRPTRQGHWPLAGRDVGTALPSPVPGLTRTRSPPSLRHEERGYSFWLCYSPCAVRKQHPRLTAFPPLTHPSVRFETEIVPFSFAALYDIALRATAIEAEVPVRRIRALGVARHADRQARRVTEVSVPDAQSRDGAPHTGAGKSRPQLDVHARHVLPGRLQYRELSIRGRTPAQVHTAAASVRSALARASRAPPLPGSVRRARQGKSGSELCLGPTQLAPWPIRPGYFE